MKAAELVAQPEHTGLGDDPVHIGCCVASHSLCGQPITGVIEWAPDHVPVDCQACLHELTLTDHGCVLGVCPETT